MIKPRYHPPHMMKQAEQIRQIWIKEYERDRRGKIVTILPILTAYSIGFWAGAVNHSIGKWLFSVVLSFAFWYGFRYIRSVFKLNI
jgi:hypothetical protein